MKDKPRISIAMPNEKDLEVMNESLVTLNSLGVEYEVIIISAHRAPEMMIDYAKNAEKRGIEVIIATAKGSAHLPGMIAAFTILPVIAVPLKSSLLDGLDSIFSMIQMPDGVPIATMPVNGAKNASIFACQIIALHDHEIKNSLYTLKEKLSKEVEEQRERVTTKFSNFV